MASRNSKRTVAVPLEQLENLHKDICDIGSFIRLALDHIGNGDELPEYDDILAARTLLLESRNRLANQIGPLGDVLPNVTEFSPL